MTTTYGAAVDDEEHGIRCHADREVAIALAMEPYIEAMDCGDHEPGDVELSVYTDPEWCCSTDQCDGEHDHDEWPQWLTGYASSETIRVRVFWVDDDGTEDDWISDYEVTP